MTASPRILANRYKLEEMIGEGSFASTFLAIDTKLLRPVAVKLLRTRYASDDGFNARFEREARAAAQVSHPNVVQVHDYGHDGDQAFIVMHYVSGPTLAEFVRGKGWLSSDEVILIVSQILDGLGAIHDTGIVHRDIKPRNILLEEDLTPKLSDFGVAYFAQEAALTQTGTTIGTAAYMAPEQATGEVVGPHADLYAVGCVLYELLTGGLPFTGPTPVQVMYQHVNDEPAPPMTRNPEIPGSLNAVIMQALEKRPESRFQSAAEMRQALMSAGTQTDEIVIAAPSGYAEQPTALSASTPPPEPQGAFAPATRRERMSPPPRWTYALLSAVVVLAVVALLTRALTDDPGTPALGGGIVATATSTTQVAGAADNTSATEVAPEAAETATPEPEPTDTPVSAPTETPPPEPEPTEPPPPEPEPTEPPPEPEPTEPPPPPEPTVPPEPDAVDAFMSETAANTPLDPGRIPDAVLGGPVVEFGRDAFVAGGAYRRPDGVLYGQPAAHLYAQTTDHPATAVTVVLDAAPARYAVIRIIGMDDESDQTAPLRITINGYVVHAGPAPFGSEVWTDTAWRVGDLGALQAGENVIVIENLAPEGEFGRPPWLLLNSMWIYAG